MSQYPSMPPPGAYIPPNESQSTPPQGYGAQQQQQQQGYQHPQAQSHSQPSQTSKSGGGTFGQMMNQAVTTSKPMLNKISKTISSKLGNKQTAPGAPQHLQSYQNNYQPHYGQQTQSYVQQQSQTFNPHQQPQQPQQSQATNAYSAQQSPYQQLSYGQGNYFTQQAAPTPPTPYAQTPPTPHQPSPVSHNGAQFVQGGNSVGGYAHGQQGQYSQGQTGQPMVQAQGPYQQQPLQAQNTGQQTGVIGSPQHFESVPNPQSPQFLNSSAGPPSPPGPQQSQWHTPYTPHTGSQQSLPIAQQQQAYGTTTPAQSYSATADSQVQSNHQQWSSLSPTASASQPSDQLPITSVSPPPPLPVQSKPPTNSNVSPQPHNTALAAQHTAGQAQPATEFIAELPADLDNLSFAERNPLDHATPSPAAQTSLYQAYQTPKAQAVSPSPGYTIARRAVSMSNVPYADPWRFADPITELPTREFYVIADLLFDALDRKFEPQSTGLLEASKILKSWIDLTEDAIRLFSYKSYSAFGKMWSLQGIPHVMVPCQPSLSPNWNFNQHSHAHELKLSPEHTLPAAYATYMPALNRAGWYKFFFLEMMHGPDNINKLMPALCNETYNPGVLHHPDLTKRDKAEAPALQARAAQIQTAAINRVCNEIKAMLLTDPDV